MDAQLLTEIVALKKTTLQVSIQIRKTNKKQNKSGRSFLSMQIKLRKGTICFRNTSVTLLSGLKSINGLYGYNFGIAVVLIPVPVQLLITTLPLARVESFLKVSQTAFNEMQGTAILSDTYFKMSSSDAKNFDNSYLLH